MKLCVPQLRRQLGQRDPRVSRLLVRRRQRASQHRAQARLLSQHLVQARQASQHLAQARLLSLHLAQASLLRLAHQRRSLLLPQLCHPLLKRPYSRRQLRLLHPPHLLRLNAQSICLLDNFQIFQSSLQIPSTL